MWGILSLGTWVVFWRDDSPWGLTGWGERRAFVDGLIGFIPIDVAFINAVPKHRW